MEYLKQYNKDYKYCTGNIGEVNEIRIGYASGAPERRGIYIYITPGTTDETGVTSYVGGSGMKVLLKSQTGFGQDKVDAVAEKLDPIVPEIATLAWTDMHGAIQLAKNKMAEP
jgi:hypothetical protein